MNKRAIAILGAIFLLIVGTLGFLIYSKYAAKTPSTTTAPVSSTQPTTTPVTQPIGGSASTTPANTANVVQLTSDQVVSPILAYSGDGITYFDTLGNLYQTNLISNNGQLGLTGKKQTNIPVKASITQILWPQKGNNFMAQMTDATGKTAWSFFNGDTGLYTDLPPQVESVDWMPSGSQIMYIWLDNNKATLNIGNPDTTGYQKVGDMWETDDSIHISPDGSQILYYETNNNSGSNAINSVSIDGKVWKGLVTAGQNFGVLWSPDSQKFLFGKKDPVTQQYQLWVYNLTSGEVKNLGLFTTVDKAVWDSASQAIYAAVPNSGVAGGTALTKDSFYRMDISTLEKKQYDTGLAAAIDGRDLFLDSTGTKLFYKNAQDGGLYYLDLTQ